MKLLPTLTSLAIWALLPSASLVAQQPGASSAPAPAAPKEEDAFSPSAHVMVFGDATYLATDRAIPSGFLIGQTVGHLIASLTERLAYFGEVTASSSSSGYSVEVERSILRYDVVDALKISGGRYHTPVGFWNTNYHHGTWLQTTVARPEMVKYGSQFIPTHFVGAMAEGTLPAGDLGVGYIVGVGNGRGATISRAGDAGDANSNRAWTAAVSVRPATMFGLQAGAGYYSDRLSTPAPTAVTAKEDITSGYVAWQRERPEFIAEYALVRHTPELGGAATSNHGYYVQLGYRLPGDASAWKPYVRTEEVVTSPTDAIFAPLALGYRGTLGGLRYDFAPYAALKLEYRREQFQGKEWSNGVYLNASFTIPGLGSGEGNPMGHI